MELFSDVKLGGKRMKAVEALEVLHKLPDSILLTTPEAAIFLQVSDTTVERWRKEGSGPRYFQGGGAAARGVNQHVRYQKADLIQWIEANKVGSTAEAAIRKGQAFKTISDLAATLPFYIDDLGLVESMVDECLVNTFVERLGSWAIQWLTPMEAGSRRWSNLASHQALAQSVQSVLADASASVRAGLEATELAQNLSG